MTDKTHAQTNGDLEDVVRLLVQGEDKPGIVAAVTTTLLKFNANIISLDQFSNDHMGGRFFQRTEFHLPGFNAVRGELEKALDEALGKKFSMTWKLSPASQLKRVAIFASKQEQCLLDLLWRQRRGELNMTVQMVISNHTDLADEVRSFGIPYFHVPITPDTRAEAEAKHLELLKDNVDLVVLARYMQIFTDGFLDNVGVPVINIHHSFLPAFIGANPYAQAKERGVKLIGATAHYVTEDLDEGPIIEQDVIRVSHTENIKLLAQHGADVERQVLSRAVAWHCDDRVMRDGNATVVF